MVILQVTLLAGATQIAPPNTGVLPNSKQFQTLIIQNNSAAVIRVGDSTVTATTGISVPDAGGILQINLGLDYCGTDLSEWWIFGTAADVIDVLWI